MRNWAGAAGIAVVAALGIAPATAEAARFCVQKPKCVKAGGTAQPTIQSALNAALANGPGRDRVELGPHTFTDGPFFAAAGNPVALVGSGIGKTALTRIPTTSGVTILRLDDPASRIADLRVRINDGSTVEGIRTRGIAERIQVASQSSDVGQTGVRLDGGGRLVRGRVLMPAAPTSTSYGLNLNGSSTVARRSSVRAAYGTLASPPGSQPARGVRLRIVATQVGLNASAGTTVLDQATIRLLPHPNSAIALNVGGVSGGNLIARHVTAVGTASPDGVGAAVDAFGIATCPVSRLVLRNSILDRFGTDLVRSASGGCFPGDPEASIDVAWSVYAAGKVIQSGPGQIRRGKGNRNVNPRFRNRAKGDYRLRRRSPLIDRGQKGRPKKGESKVDLAGRKRVLDGNGNGKARRDIGAFERR